MKRASGVAAAAAVVGLAAGIAGAAEAPPPDAFYLGLLRQGRTALARGDAGAAKRELRLACFGFLEHPTLLAECRIRLGLAEAKLGDREAFVDSFGKLEEIEQRFGVYAAAAVTPDERLAFEDKVVEWVAPEILQSIAAFASLGERRAETELARLAPRERTKELERRAAAEPGEARWKLLLAADELERKRPGPALAQLETLADAAGSGEAGCLKGRSLAELERCQEAAPRLAACGRSSTDPVLAERRLRCALELESWTEARAFAAALPESIAKRTEIRRQLDRIPEAKPPGGASAGKGLPASGSASPRSEPLRSQPAPATKAPAPVKPVSPSPSAADRAELAAVRDATRTASKRDELQRLLERARPLADRYPRESDLQLLAGEIAYRAGQWQAGVDYLRRPDASGPSDPTLRFYLAVCQFESGDRSGAAKTAATGLEKLQRSTFVDGYLRKIHSSKP